MEKLFRRVGRSKRSKAILEIITIIPVIGEKFGLDAAKAGKKIQKCSHRVWAISEKRKFVPSSSGRGAVSSWNSSSLFTQQNR